jgi:hypothetical protein
LFKLKDIEDVEGSKGKMKSKEFQSNHSGAAADHIATAEQDCTLSQTQWDRYPSAIIAEDMQA